MKSIWDILGIEPTHDKKIIKQAYASQSKFCHPEDNPEAFKVLQQAYKSALAYASNENYSKSSLTSTSEVSTKKTHKVHVDSQDKEETKDVYPYSKDVDLDDLEIEYSSSKANKLFNDKNILEQFENNQAYQNYIFESFIKQIGRRLDEDKLQLFIENTNLLIQCYDQDFCIKVDDYLSHCRFHLKKLRYAYWTKTMNDLHFEKTAEKLRKIQIKKNRLPKSVFFPIIVVVAMNIIFDSPTPKQKTPQYKPQVNIVKQETIDTTNIDYYTNVPYLNGVKYTKNNDKYILKNKEGKIINSEIKAIQFTNSPIILYQKSKFYLLDTSDMKTIQRTYKAAMVVNVIKDGESQKEKMYVASYDGYYWKLYDLKGNAVYQFEEKRDQKDIPKTIYIHDQKATFEP
ncbi:MAG: J domain-containing protein [Coprobacillus cateniformis]|uniref:J domain-containing protein n=1 Tax=Longibaculum muris TaxID=1796628 RepID=UPI003AB8412A|nr:J domain-containing protein [Coprobacillus cateniformis]